MATQTTNLGLTKPGYDEAADVVPAVNNNMDTLDQKIGAVPANSSVQGQLDSHTQAIGNLSNLTTTEKGSLVGAANELNSKSIKKETVTATTDSNGVIKGSTRDIFGVAGAIILTVYPKRGNYSVNRSVNIATYGDAGYTLTFKDETSIIASSSVTFDVYYFVP